MADPIRTRLEADRAAGNLAPLADYQRLFPGREADVARVWSAVGGKPSSSSAGAHLEDATRAVIALEALGDPGFARLAVGETIGRGGMGEVLAARDEVLRRNLALKRVRPEVLEAADEDEAAPLTQRLLEEAQITAQLDHPGVVPVHELGLDAARRPYFTMKRVHGRTLDEVLRREREGQGRSLARTLQIFVRICETLAYAHKKGVVHRDVKPANVMVGRYGEVYLMDWGLAKLRADPSAPRSAAPEAGATGVITTDRAELLRRGSDPALTLHGQIVGTVGYLPPEQLVGGPADERSDVYAVGAMLYELLAGHAPYCEPDAGGDARAALLRLLKEPPAPLAQRAPSAPPELVAIAEKAMARDPERRFASADALAEELHAFLEGRVVRSHRTGLWIELSKWVRRNRWLAAGVAAALVAATGTVVAFVAQQRRAAVAIGAERDRAREEAERAQAAGRRADGLRLAAQSRLLTDDPGLALALAVEAGRRAPGSAATSSIFHALRRHREWRYLAGHESYLAHVAWTADGARLVSADEVGTSVVWDVAAGAPLRWLEGAPGTTGGVLALALAPDGRRVATAHRDGVVRLWDPGADDPVRQTEFAATSLRFLPGGALLLAGATGSVAVWDVEGSERRELVRTDEAWRMAEGVAPTARTLALTGLGRLLLIDAAALTARAVDGPTAEGAADAPPPFAVQSEALRRVLVRWGPRDVRLHDLDDGSEHLRLPLDADLESAAFSGDGARLVLGLRAPAGPRVEVRDARTLAIVATFPVEAPVAVLPTRDGRAFAAVDRMGATWVELGTRPRLIPLRGHRYTVAHAALSPDERLLATGSHDNTVRIWALAPENERSALAPRVEAGQRVLGWSQDATRALVALPRSGSSGGGLEVVDTLTGKVSARFDAPAEDPANGGLDATGGEAWWLAGSEWRAADVSTGVIVRSARLAEAPTPGAGAVPSPDGRRLAVPIERGVGVFDLATGAVVGRVGKAGLPMRITWAADGRHLVIAHPALGHSALYALDGEEPLRRYVGHTGYVTDARTDPDSRWVISAAADTSVRVFDLERGELLGIHRGLPLRGTRTVVGPRRDVLGVVTSKFLFLELSPEGRLREAATLERESDDSLTFHPDGRRFWLVDESQRARVWDLDAVSAGERALTRPVLRVDAVAEYEPDPAAPLDAPWYARSDPWWSLQRAQRLLAQARWDEAEQALDLAARARPRWPVPDLERVRIAAARATARGTVAGEAAPELVRLLDAAAAKGAGHLAAHAWHASPAELAPYVGDERVAAAVKRVMFVYR